MVTFLKKFYSLYHFSFLSLLPIHTFFFFFSFFFFLFFSSTRCPYISLPPSFICFVFLLQEHSKLPASASVALILRRSLLFFFFNLIPEGIMDKVFFISFPLSPFFPIWGDEICGSGRENFLPGFPLSLISSLSQTVENNVFHSIFPSMFSIPLKSPQPNTV